MKDDSLIVSGNKLKLHFGDNNINNETIYILSIVDKEQVVFKKWSSRKKRWNYQIQSIHFFSLIEDKITKVKS